MMNSFSRIELERYARHFSLPELGGEGQYRLKKSKVLCVGAGGLGSAALFYLAAAGVGTLGIVDGDQIDLSNLQRQILYGVADIGKLKVDVARERLLALNPHLDIQTYPFHLTNENALAIIAEYDVVIDATDNYAARYLVNDACFHLQKPDIFACILRFAGQCTVFAMPNGPCYRCLFPTPPTADYMPNCAEAGVLGALPGLLGNMQAIEALKYILQIGNLLTGRFLTVDVLSMQWHESALQRDPACPLCGKNIAFSALERPAAICKVVKEVSLSEFAEWQARNEAFFLLDVRESAEYEENNLGGYLIPLNELLQRLNELDKEQRIVVHCKMGGRSAQAVSILSENGFLNVWNLKGGLVAWQEFSRLG